MHIWATSMTTFLRGSSNQTPTRRGFLWRSSMVSLLKWHNTRYTTLKACSPPYKVEIRCLANKMFLDSERLSMKCRGFKSKTFTYSYNGKPMVRYANKKLCTRALFGKQSFTDRKIILCKSSDKALRLRILICAFVECFLAGRDIEISQGSEGGRKEPRACLIPWEVS